MASSTKLSLIAISVLIAASIIFYAIFKMQVSADTLSQAESPVAGSVELNQGWNTITAEQTFTLKTAQIKQAGVANILPVSQTLGLIGDRIISVEDGRILGMENIISKGDKIKIYLNQASPSGATLFVPK